jgi:uncharacterized membrane protein
MRKVYLVSSAMLTVFCSLMLFCRMFFTSSLVYSFMWWNLFLALVPLLAATMFSIQYKKKGMYSAGNLLLFISWLLFFPNAPYIITDLIHLADNNPGIPLWYDALMLFSFAFTGLFSGFFSLFLIYKVFKDYLKSHKGYWFIPLVFFLSGYGIYLGRVLRWNSWDAFTRPHVLVGDIYTNANDPIAWSMTVFFSAFLFLIWQIVRYFLNVNNIKF